MIKMLTGNRLLIDIFGKLVYLLPVERYKCTCRARVCSRIYIFLCTVILTYEDLAKFLIILMIPEPCSTSMLDDQPFLIDFTMFLSQCNRMTITGL